MANPIAEHGSQEGCDKGCERTLQLKARGTETTVRDSIGMLVASEVDLSVAAQLRALRHYADSVRMVDRPQFQRMLDEAAKPEAPF